MDPMAGGGSIPLEARRLGFNTLANEYNPVACSILEATIDYPFRFGKDLADKARYWAKIWEKRFTKRVERFFPDRPHVAIRDYVFARTVPCPDTGYMTPLVPDWHLSKPKDSNKIRVIAEPVVDREKGTWHVRIRELGRGAGQLRNPPRPTYSDGKGISFFTDRPIPANYIKAKAQQGQMQSVLYAIVIKDIQGYMAFQAPEQKDHEALADAEKELQLLRPKWEKNNIIPTEQYPSVSSDKRPRLYGMPCWSDMFSSRQLLCMGVLVEELQNLRRDIVNKEGQELGEAVIHLLSFVLDKFCNHNCYLNRWENTRTVVKGKMDRHDFAFKPAFAELAACNAGGGLTWAADHCIQIVLLKE